MREQRHQSILVAQHQLFKCLRIPIAHLQHQPNVGIGQRISFGSRLANRQLWLVDSRWAIGQALPDASLGVPPEPTSRRLPYSAYSPADRSASRARQLGTPLPAHLKDLTPPGTAGSGLVPAVG